MATITIPRGTVAAGGAASAPLYGRTVQQKTVIVDLVNAAAVKGSALATADVIQTVAVPAHSAILGVYTKVLEVADVSTLNFDVGLGTDVDLYVDEGSLTTLGRVNPLMVGFTSSLNYTATYDTIDVLLMTFSGTVPTTGQIEVNVIVAQFPDNGGANIADIQ